MLPLKYTSFLKSGLVLAMLSRRPEHLTLKVKYISFTEQCIKTVKAFYSAVFSGSELRESLKCLHVLSLIESTDCNKQELSDTVKQSSLHIF